MRLGERNRLALELFRYLFESESYLRKPVNPQVAIFFSLTRPGEVKILPKEFNSGTIELERPKNLYGFLSHSSIPIRGEMAWGLHPPPPPICILGWGNSMCG